MIREEGVFLRSSHALDKVAKAVLFQSILGNSIEPGEERVCRKALHLLTLYEELGLPAALLWLDVRSFFHVRD